MEIYLIQHGKAEKGDDGKKHLTDDGREEISKTSEFLSKNKISCKILHSPKARARQSAEIIAKKTESKMVEMDGLLPMDDPDEVIKKIDNDCEDVIIIGHLPNLRVMASKLLGIDPETKVLKFTNAGIICLTKEETWCIRYSIPPKIIYG
jgi:phosphohistidine phosphatase SixA